MHVDLSALEGGENDATVRHLVELGYVDPQVIAAREAALRHHFQSELTAAKNLYEQGRHDEAIDILERLCRDDSDWIAPRQVLAEIHFRIGRFAEARAQLAWLAYHGVEHPRLAMLEGAMALSRRDLPLAVELLTYARHTSPELPGIHTLHAIAFLRQGKLSAAAEEFQRALQINPADARALDGLATICLRRRDFAEAADWALQALDRDIQFARAHYHLGVSLVHLDRPNEAAAAFETCSRLEPLRAAPFFWLARLSEVNLSDLPRAAHYRELGRQTIRRRRERSQVS